jgi:phage tail-like protein
MATSGPASIDRFLGHANRFKVVLDDGDVKDLGMWQKCDGLEVEFKTKEVKDGGHYEHSYYLPEMVVYKPVTLTRALAKDDSPKVQRWLAKQARDLKGNGLTITVYDHTLGGEGHTPVASWSLRNAKPTDWKCVTLDVGSSKVAVETLKFVHEGFLE